MIAAQPNLTPLLLQAICVARLYTQSLYSALVDQLAHVCAKCSDLRVGTVITWNPTFMALTHTWMHTGITGNWIFPRVNDALSIHFAHSVKNWGLWTLYGGPRCRGNQGNYGDSNRGTHSTDAFERVPPLCVPQTDTSKAYLPWLVGAFPPGSSRLFSR